jgi:hypothetical protein
VVLPAEDGRRRRPPAGLALRNKEQILAVMIRVGVTQFVAHLMPEAEHLMTAQPLGR